MDQETIQANGEEISSKLSDEELLTSIKDDITRVDSRFKRIEAIAEKNEKYWAGDQLNKERLPAGEDPLFVNRILISTETIAAIITQETPPPWIIVTPRKKASRLLQSKVERQLYDLWEYTLNMQGKMETLLRQYLMQRVGVMKVFWNDRTDELDAKPLRLSKVRFDLEATSIDESRFFAEKLKANIGTLMRMFPEKKDYFQAMITTKRYTTKTELVYWEHHADYEEDGRPHVLTTWIHNNEILGRETDIYWNSRKSNNHFKYPRKPYVVLNSLRTGKSLIDETSIIEQAIPLQDAVNERKRQIRRNAWLANGIMVATAAAMSKETFEKIGPRTSKIFLDQETDNVGNGFAKVTGRSMESGVYEDMYHSIREIDNLFGSQDVVRGERSGPETLGGRRLLLSQSLGRQDLTRRAYEQVAEEIYNWWIQIMRVKYDDQRDIITAKSEVQPEEEAKRQAGLVVKDEDIISKKDFVGFHVKIIVKAGTTRAKDPEARREDAITLAQTGMINPLTMFEMMGLEDPKSHARRQFLWESGQGQMLFPELGGDQFTEPVAIQHIMDINNGIVGADEDLYDNAEDVEEFIKHVQTHNMYIQGVEVEEDLELFDNLSLEVQNQHKRHLRMESMKLQTFLEQLQGRVPEERGSLTVPQ